MAISKVLVVDDDTSVRRLVCDVLQAYGYATVSANDGFSALRMMQSEHPDCVILDVMMPGLDGHAVLNRIRESEGGSDLPVVMLTASREEQDLVRTYDLGVNSYIVKPVDFAQFVEAIHQVGLYWLVHNESV